MPDITNAMTVDVEDYFHVSAFAGQIPTSSWDHFESRVEQNTLCILKLLDARNIRGTFFVLGWVADRHPELVRSIHAAGHEVACHSYWHRLVYDLSPDEFRTDLCRSRDVLQNIIGEPVTMYRAPSFSITKKSNWAYEILAEEGFTVDSSVFPIMHDRYGNPDAEPRPHWVETLSGAVCEFPAAVHRSMGFNVPISGGGYFRLYPHAFTRQLLRNVNAKGVPFTFYIHPWEIDPDQPRLAGSWLSKFRHYLNLNRTERKFEALLPDFKFSTMTDALVSYGMQTESVVDAEPEAMPAITVHSARHEQPREILYVTHRVPFPPNRGDRIRTYHTLRHLSQRGNVSLACLADEPVTDETRRELNSLCERVTIVPVAPKMRWLRAGTSFATGQTISQGAFHSPQLDKTTREWCAERNFDVALCSSSVLARYISHPGTTADRRFVDLIDVDSQKWFDYAADNSVLKRWLYKAEGSRLRELESQLGLTCQGLAVVSEAEAEIYRNFAPHGNIRAIPNGVDLDYFQPPAVPQEVDGRCVFVGALDYKPNIDGAIWFCNEVWPLILERTPNATLELVGREPVKAVRNLAEIPGVSVAGSVPDVRPHLRDASVVVVPLQIARGVQNKVLEALAMGKALVTSKQPTIGLGTEEGVHLVTAESPAEWADSVTRLLADAEYRSDLGLAGRIYVDRTHQWHHCLSALDELLGLSPTREGSKSQSRLSIGT